MYSNDKNFYSVEDIEPLAQKILLVGLMENLEVVRDPCDRGEYRIIAGERRWRALKILVEKGYTEFEKATCQIQTPASEEEETLRLIIANDYRNKTVSDLLEEEDKLKKILQRMKENGQTIMGIDLNSGRIRDVVAYFLKIAPTKVAQIENINKHLIPEFSKELKEGRLTFSAAYMISGMNEETQAEMLERYQENGLTYKEVGRTDMDLLIYIRARKNYLHTDFFTITAIIFKALTTIMTKAMIVTNYKRLYLVTFLQNGSHKIPGSKPGYLRSKIEHNAIIYSGFSQ